MASKDFNQATRILGVMDQQIRKGTKSGARIDVTYGQVYGVSGGYASVYIAGSRELAALTGEVAIPSDYFRIPTILDVAASDYVRISIDDRGHRWIDEVLGPTKINALSIAVGGQITAASVAASGAVTAGSVAATGAVTAGSVAATGAVTAGSASVTGAVAAGEFQLDGRLAWVPSRLEGFIIENVAASLTDEPVGRFTSAQNVIFANRPIVGRNGRVVGVAWRKSAAMSGGNASLRLTIAGGASTVLESFTSGSSNSGFTAITPVGFTSTQSIGVNITTDGSYAPTTLDWACDLLVEYEPL